jgi:arylsulfatase A-like enzyme
VTELARPDIVVVIFDALRADGFPGGAHPTEGMPFTSQLLRESIAFPRASSVTPWTVPAHASAFTGLYPWENGCHAKNNLVLSPTVPRLPSALASVGYRSLLLSSNPLVCPRFGLADGFTEAGWGIWLETYMRRLRTDHPPSTLANEQAESTFLGRFRDGPLGRIVINSTEAAFRYPYLFDVLDQMHQKLKRGNGGRDISTSPWIEPSLREWVGRQPKGTPVFCAINICDTHEPYYWPPGWSSGIAPWWSRAKVRQDFVKCIVGDWSPTPEELRVLRDLYRFTVQNSDRRLAQIAQVFKDAGRWENTVLIATSDHGQAFGEHGELFHLNGVIDPMLRIPIIYRPAGGLPAGVRGEGWASIIDLAPTILRDAAAPAMNLPSAVALQDLAHLPRPKPVFAVSDGLVWSHLKKLVPESRKAEFDRLRVVAYSDRWKLVTDFTRKESFAYDLEADPDELRNRWPEAGSILGSIPAQSTSIGEAMTRGPPAPLTDEIEERLKSWGYL